MRRKSAISFYSMRWLQVLIDDKNRMGPMMYVQTIYMVGMGLGILLMPQLLLPLFGFTPPAEV
jgi:hypothetical protein